MQTIRSHCPLRQRYLQRNMILSAVGRKEVHQALCNKGDTPSPRQHTQLECTKCPLPLRTVFWPAMRGTPPAGPPLCAGASSPAGTRAPSPPAAPRRACGPSRRLPCRRRRRWAGSERPRRPRRACWGAAVLPTWWASSPCSRRKEKTIGLAL